MFWGRVNYRQILIDPCYFLIAHHSSQFNLDVRPVKVGPTEMEISTKIWKIELADFIIKKKPAGTRRLEPSGKIKGSEAFLYYFLIRHDDQKSKIKSNHKKKKKNRKKDISCRPNQLSGRKFRTYQSKEVELLLKSFMHMYQTWHLCIKTNIGCIKKQGTLHHFSYSLCFYQAETHLFHFIFFLLFLFLIFFQNYHF